MFCRTVRISFGVGTRKENCCIRLLIDLGILSGSVVQQINSESWFVLSKSVRIDSKAALEQLWNSSKINTFFLIGCDTKDSAIIFLTSSTLAFAIDTCLTPIRESLSIASVISSSIGFKSSSNLWQFSTFAINKASVVLPVPAKPLKI